MKKNFVLLLTTLLFGLCLLTGCASEKTEDAAVDRTLQEIYTEMVNNVELPPMIQMEDDYITNYYGADLSTFEEYVFASAEDALLAENIILVKMKEGNSNEAVVKLLENIIKQKKNELENYLPDQFKIVEKSEVVTNGDYVVLIISSQKDALEDTLPAALK